MPITTRPNRTPSRIKWLLQSVSHSYQSQGSDEGGPLGGAPGLEAL